MRRWCLTWQVKRTGPSLELRRNQSLSRLQVQRRYLGARSHMRPAKSSTRAWPRDPLCSRGSARAPIIAACRCIHGRDAIAAFRTQSTVQQRGVISLRNCISRPWQPGRCTRVAASNACNAEQVELVVPASCGQPYPTALGGSDASCRDFGCGPRDHTVGQRYRMQAPV
jgi:hypothetical protein